MILWVTLHCERECLVEACIGPSCGEDGPECTLGTVRQWELDLGVMELLDVWTSALLGWYCLHLHDLDTRSPCSVTGTHVTVALCDSTSSGQITVLSVHVVRSTPWVVSKPDAEILDLCWLGLIDLPTGDNFPFGLLDFLQFLDEVPKAGLGGHMVWCKDAHLVEGRKAHLIGGYPTVTVDPCSYGCVLSWLRACTYCFDDTTYTWRNLYFFKEFDSRRGWVTRPTIWLQLGAGDEGGDGDGEVVVQCLGPRLVWFWDRQTAATP